MHNTTSQQYNFKEQHIAHIISKYSLIFTRSLICFRCTPIDKLMAEFVRDTINMIYWSFAFTHNTPGSKGDGHFFKIKLQHHRWLYGVKCEGCRRNFPRRVSFISFKMLQCRWTGCIWAKYWPLCWDSRSGHCLREVAHSLGDPFDIRPWWRHHGPVPRSFHVFFDLHLNKPLSKQSWGWWFETLWCPSWRHCNVFKYRGREAYICVSSLDHHWFR